MKAAIAKIQRANIGDHFHAFGLRGMSALINPFINVDHAWMSAPTFPPHRHAGFSAVSYVFADSETGIDNRDSLGTHNLIRPGGLHWITAGSGVMHQENPAEEGKTVHSLQIFIALPPGQESIEPFPLTLEPDEIPEVDLPGVKLRVALGSFGETRSPLTPPTEVTILDITLEAGAELSVPVASGSTAFVLPVSGAVSVAGQMFTPDRLEAPVFNAETGQDAIHLAAPHERVHLMVFGGNPFARF